MLYEELEITINIMVNKGYIEDFPCNDYDIKTITDLVNKERMQCNQIKY